MVGGSGGVDWWNSLKLGRFKWGWKVTSFVRWSHPWTRATSSTFQLPGGYIVEEPKYFFKLNSLCIIKIGQIIKKFTFEGVFPKTKNAKYTDLNYKSEIQILEMSLLRSVTFKSFKRLSLPPSILLPPSPPPHPSVPYSEISIFCKPPAAVSSVHFLQIGAPVRQGRPIRGKSDTTLNEPGYVKARAGSLLQTKGGWCVRVCARQDSIRGFVLCWQQQAKKKKNENEKCGANVFCCFV